MLAIYDNMCVCVYIYRERERESCKKGRTDGAEKLMRCSPLKLAAASLERHTESALCSILGFCSLSRIGLPQLPEPFRSEAAVWLRFRRQLEMDCRVHLLTSSGPQDVVQLLSYTATV